MSKHADNLHDAASRPLPEPDPEPAPRLHGIPGRVTAADLAIIRRAIVLNLATVADLDDDSAESSGRALASICRLYLLFERELRNEQSQRHADKDTP